MEEYAQTLWPCHEVKTDIQPLRDFPSRDGETCREGPFWAGGSKYGAGHGGGGDRLTQDHGNEAIGNKLSNANYKYLMCCLCLIYTMPLHKKENRS